MSIWIADTEYLQRPAVIPKHEDCNGWWNVLPEPPAPRVVNGNIRVETAIVGAGVCGLAVAHQLGKLRPDAEIALIEAERAGFGASGRNAGFMLNLHSHGTPKRTGTLRRNMKLWASGLSDLRRMTREFQIDCDWDDYGRIYGAAGRDGEKRIDEIAETLDQLGQDRRWLSQDDMEERIGTRFYGRGLYTPGNALVNPAALMRGIARNLPANVTLFEESPVIGLENSGSGFALETAQGSVNTDRLVLATGVFLRQFGIASGCYIPMATYASLSDPMSDHELSMIGPGGPFGLLASSEYGATIRLTHDKRLFFRNLFEFAPNASAPARKVPEIKRIHREAMLKRWPGLASVDFVHGWGGTMAFTWNDGAVLTNDVSPMTRGAAAGRLLADFMDGGDSELLGLQLGIPGASRLPPRPFLDIGIAVRRGFLHLAAHSEF